MASHHNFEGLSQSGIRDLHIIIGGKKLLYTCSQMLRERVIMKKKRVKAPTVF